MITLLAGVAVFYVDHYPHIDSSLWAIGFAVSFILFIITIILCAYATFLSYHHYEYKNISVPDQILTRMNDLVAYYEKRAENTEILDDRVKEDLLDNMISLYTTATITNRNSNLLRISYLYWSTRLIGIAMIWLFFQASVIA